MSHGEIAVRATSPYDLAGANIQTQVKVKASLTHYGSGFFGATTFTFPYAPVEVSYSGLSRQYTEIARPGDWPLIDSVGPQLMKVQLQFRVADPASNGTVSIEPQLDKLRLISLIPGPILVANMDAYLSRPIAPTLTFEGLKLAFFRMTDLSVTVKRRNRDNLATQADCQMTLTEDRNPYIPAIALPPIDYSDTPQRRTVASVSTAGGSPVQQQYQTITQRAGYVPPRTST
jgi:hypothetical protein